MLVFIFQLAQSSKILLEIEIMLRVYYPVLEIRAAQVACWEDQRHLGGPKSWVTKKFDSR